MVFCLQSRLSLFKSHPFRCRRYTIERTRTRMRRSLISKAYERTRVYIFLICALCSVACGAVCAMMVNPCVRQNVTGFKLIYGWNTRLKTKKYRAERGTAEDGKCKRSNTPVIINFLKNTRHGCANGYRLEATLHAQRLRKGRTPFSTRTPLASTGAQRRIVADATPAGAPRRPKTSPRRRAAHTQLRVSRTSSCLVRVGGG
jgi:hypothetical protein